MKHGDCVLDALCLYMSPPWRASKSMCIMQCIVMLVPALGVLSWVVGYLYQTGKSQSLAAYNPSHVQLLYCTSALLPREYRLAEACVGMQSLKRQASSGNPLSSRQLGLQSAMLRFL